MRPDPPRLVLITPGLSEQGGLARRSRLIAYGLADRGWEVRAICRTGAKRWPRITRSERLLVVEVPGFGRPRAGAIAFFLVALPLVLVWSGRARVIVALQLMSTATVAAVCGGLRQRPFVAMSSGSGELGEVRYLRSRRSARLRTWLLSRAAVLLAQTPNGAVELSGLIPGMRVEVVPNPVVLPRQIRALPSSASAVYTGRLSEEKDLLHLLDAWRGIAAADPACRLTLVGAGGGFRSVEAELRSRVALDPDLVATVSMPGWIGDVSETLEAHAVYVFPSLSEGMSNALLEALVHGRVIVASDIPPNVAVVGEGYPLLFPAGDVSAMRAALRSALYDQHVRLNALHHLQARVRMFSSETIFAQLDRLLCEVAGESPAVHRCTGV